MLYKNSHHHQHMLLNLIVYRSLEELSVLVDGCKLVLSDLTLQYQPARGHDKEQVAEDRQGRRYRPYGGRQDRDSRSERQERGTDCDWQRRWGAEHKPVASFQLAYK